MSIKKKEYVECGEGFYTRTTPAWAAVLRRRMYNVVFSAVIVLNIIGWVNVGYHAGTYFGVRSLQKQAIDLELAEYNPKTADWGFLTAEMVSMKYTSAKMAKDMPRSTGIPLP